MKHALLGLLLALLGGLLQVPKETRPIYAEFPPAHGKMVVYVHHVHDGDTVDGFFLVPVKFRLYGCNAPEINTDQGKASQHALAAMLPPGMTQAELMGKDKYYGRVVAKLMLPDGSDATATMIAAKWAVAWDGKGVKP